MAWQQQLKGDSVSWLLEAAEPSIRYMVLRDLLDHPASDPDLLAARKEMYQKSLVTNILDHMNPEGWWGKEGGGYSPKYYSTVWSLILLSQLGAHMQFDKRIATAVAYYLDHAFCENGQIATNGTPSFTIDCLQGNMLTALLDLGCDDARLDKAFEWMARTVTGEGLAPCKDKKAELRYYAYKCGPNFACGANEKQPCAWGATKVMLAFSRLPETKRTLLVQKAIRMGVDFFFGVDPATADYPNGQSDHPSRNWWKFGFPVYYVTDLLQIAEALVGLGYGKDSRLINTLKLIREKQDAQGRWLLEYHYNEKTRMNSGKGGQPNPWVTLRAARVLKRASE